MADIRIKVAKDKAQFIKALRATDETSTPFQSYADALVFAAALGIKQGRREPIKEYSKEIDPIRQDIFSSKDYDQVINLLAIADTNDPNSLASNVIAEEERIKIFEEYANAGLEILEEIFKGSVNYSEQLLLFLSSERNSLTIEDNEFDLSSFL
ncbi:DNA phosphorothioation-associated protein 4 [Trichocoleus sp. FACHB-591]|uniref:DNA phosphorothioation-associated protein 4 n=1 Tax=Trichocoleus sp. FACHB-591 TaxID=2692872 RepID=UPI0016843AF4|nr:DNA phosphorothioation-associated protein 4 [Trichocoleus sp. FACHB-591]MBD2094474.1 DNA phosphorothioation-associated protein 4 [Trichocoleus sp. FACHB-591]